MDLVCAGTRQRSLQRFEGRSPRPGGIGADVAYKAGLESEDRAVLLYRQLDVTDLVLGVIGAVKIFAPILDPLDRAFELVAQRGKQYLFREDVAFHPEAAAHVG